MSHKPNHIVFTTIYVPAVLHDLYENISRFSHLETTKVWVVGDNITPVETEELCKVIDAKGLEISYIDIASQDEWGERCPKLYQRIPYNNETRRNIGYLRALEEGCERIISIDDDNFPIDQDLVGLHEIAGRKWSGPVLQSENGFYNLCADLRFKPARDIYPRGYPFRLRGKDGSVTEHRSDSSTIIGVNAGLWLREPDIDATTWLNGRVEGTEYKGPSSGVLDATTWTPINTQNTSVVRDLIPAYLCVPMGWDVPGGKIQRYGDIWGGYFLQALIKNSSYRVAFGHPVVEHRRNPHDYVDDLRFEFWGMMLTDWLVDILKDRFNPQENRMTSRVQELAEFILSDAISRMPAWCPNEMKTFLEWTAGNLSSWGEACELLAPVGKVPGC